MRIIHNSKYISIHQWVSRHYGKASICIIDSTHTSKQFEWSNISGKYIKDIKDWRQLCNSCHKKIDYTGHKKGLRRKYMLGNTIKRKAVIQFDLEGNIIHKYASIAEASKLANISTGMLSETLKGKFSKAKGYIWKGVVSN